MKLRAPLPPGPSVPLAAAPVLLPSALLQEAYEQADEDMFASDDEEGGKAKGKVQTAAEGGVAAAQNGAGGSAAPAAAAAAPVQAPQALPPAAAAAAGGDDGAGAGEVDYSSWPVKELRRFLTGALAGVALGLGSGARVGMAGG